jgi:hypothetical protein
VKTFLAVTIGIAVLILLFGSATAQDQATGKPPIRPDLPLDKPVPELPPEDPDEPEDPAEPPGEEGAPPPPGEEGAPPPPGEEGTPPVTEEPEAPMEEEPPQNPPPEFFEEPIEEAEVIFVIDRTGSMRWPSKMSVVDEGGNPVNNAAKVDVARIELIKAINNLAENMKFALVCFSTASHYVSGSVDPNYSYGSPGRWNAWPPANGEPAPFGWHSQASSDVPVWPSTKTLVAATPENKAAATAWAQGRLPSPGADPGYSQVRGGTCTHDGMSAGLAMVSPPSGGGGGGSEPEKSATAIYLLTDGAPTHLMGAAYCLCQVITTYDSGDVRNAGTWEQLCMDTTKVKILAENIYHARIYTLGMGMNMSCPNAHVWNPGRMDWDVYPTEYNNKCRQFLTSLAEATGGHYREVSQ